MTTRIGQTAILLHAGDRQEARSRFGALWAEIGASGDARHRCLLAHYMADAQDDPRDELLWDLRALAAADDAADPVGTGATELRGFYPSLHLNLATAYAKLGRREAARSHLRSARILCDALADDVYGQGVRAAIGRLDARLAGD
ncbi:hypothetical protein HNQ79_004226 [Streptomyces candidus]|uniref:Tetratricopeptide repeat protein n=1 Tax=Streptomyces candidus TaxID=67283 RepID=A0A7X0HJV8_9ACTN|nr:hypothetical protein [Streptomyces candidus]